MIVPQGLELGEKLMLKCEEIGYANNRPGPKSLIRKCQLGKYIYSITYFIVWRVGITVLKLNKLYWNWSFDVTISYNNMKYNKN